jgi:hypothetical protein
LGTSAQTTVAAISTDTRDPKDITPSSVDCLKFRKFARRLSNPHAVHYGEIFSSGARSPEKTSGHCELVRNDPQSLQSADITIWRN